MEKSTHKTIGVVIPGYGHPQFLAEAIIGACEQEIDRPVRVVVIDDGCKFPETGQMVGQLMEKYTGTLHYLRQENTRLPGARNAGVRFLMALEPDLDSVYFLDADNRIAPYTLSAFRHALGEDAKIGWAYPDISMFGMSRGEDGFDTRETAPEYNKLKHLVGNISEAGSLVRADVFRAGVFYNEEMTSGFEDWDFWLSALDAGFEGKRARYSGFMYRRRPESMLADSRRLEETLISRIRQSHKALFAPKNILALEQKEAPVFAIYIVGADEILLTSDPKSKPTILSMDVFRQKLHNWAYDSREYFFPQYFITISQVEWQRLQKSKAHSRWMFWQLRERALDTAYVTQTLSDHIAVHIASAATKKWSEPASFLCSKTSQIKSLLLASLNSWDKKTTLILSDQIHVQIKAPALEPLPTVKPKQGKDLIFPYANEMGRRNLEWYFEKFVRGMMPLDRRSLHQTRKYAGPSCQAIRAELISEICAVEEREPFPANTAIDRAMVFVGAEMLNSPVAAAKFADLLKGLKSSNYETMVILETEPYQDMAALDLCWWSEADDIVPILLSGGTIEYRIYLGRRVSTKLDLLSREDMTVLARSCDILVSCGAAAGLEAFGQAKPQGAKGYVWLDPVFMGKDQDEMAQQAKLLAFEHAVERVITNDEAYVHGLSAEGFPPSKFETSEAFWKKLCTTSR